MIQEKSICCAGEVMLELAPGDDHNQFHLGFAGDTYNTAVYLSRAGHPTHYFTALGDDAYSEAITAHMNAESIGTRQVITLPDRLPGLYMIRNDAQGERYMSYWRSSSAARAMFDQLPDLPAADLFYFSGITLAVAITGLDHLLLSLQALRTAGTRIAFDTNFRPALWQEENQAEAAYRAVLPLCDLVLASQEDDSLLWGINDANTSQQHYRGYGAQEIVVKNERLECAAWSEAAAFSNQATAVTPVDTTGAGDAFNAAYLSARLEGEGLEAAVKAAQALSARVVAHRGAILPMR